MHDYATARATPAWQIYGCRMQIDVYRINFTHERQRSIPRAIKGKTSAWLNVVPLESCHFDLAPSQFRDGLAIRYQRQPSCIPITCDGCSANFTLQRALDCKTGGLVIQRHNKVRDCLGDMAAQVWSQVVREPIVKEAESKADGPGLRADLGIRGVWTPHAGGSVV